MSKLDIGKIRLLDIEPADYNPRRINDTEFSKLSKSIKDFGLVDPIIINLKNNKIIGGHQRYQVLLDEYTSNDTELYILKLGDIGWVFPTADLKIQSEEHEKALNILLNQTNLMGEWDDVKLEMVLTELNDMDFDLDMTGFEDYELELYLDDNYEPFNMSNYDNIEDERDNDLPDDYMDVQGDNGNKSYVIGIGFNDKETANKYLDFLGYPNHMNRDSVQFMFTDLNLDIDQMLKDKYGEDYFTNIE